MTKTPPEVTPSIQSLLITPELAKDWLERNTRNRPIDARRVQALADAMTAGKFLLTHQGIAFDPSGVLLDGQHRLLAVVRSGVAVRMSVTWGVDQRSLEVIDTGRARSAAQTLAIQGTPCANAIAAICRTAMVGMSPTNGSAYQNVLAFAHAHAESAASYVALSRKLTASVAGAFLRAQLVGMHGVRGAADRLLALQFDHDGDPMRALANRLRDRLTSRSRYAAAVTALRAVDEGRALKVVKDAVLDLPEIA